MAIEYETNAPNAIDKGDFWIVSSQQGKWNTTRILEALDEVRPLPAPLGWGISLGDSGQFARIVVRPDGEPDFEKIVQSPALATYRWRMIGRGEGLLPYLCFTLQR